MTEATNFTMTAMRPLSGRRSAVLDSARQPAIDADVLTRDVAGPLRGEERDRRGDLLCRPVPLQGTRA